MSRTYRISTLVGLLLAAFTLVCRFSTPVADWYALKVYPPLSATLSWMASGLTCNLEEPVIGLLIAAAFLLIALGIRRRWGVWRCLRYVLTLVLWTYVWFYWAWCINYSRSSIYARSGSVATSYGEEAFRTFLTDYTERLNGSWTADTLCDPLTVETDVKRYYAQVPAKYGLAKPRSWHHPKRIWLNRLYSQSGILGFMAPLFSESCLNADLLAIEYPSTYAHEYAHLLGVSNEAETSWWAYQACTASCHRAIRYSGYFEVLPYVYRDAAHFLPHEEFEQWVSTLRPEVKADLKAESRHWQSLRSDVVRKAHEEVYDTFLKSNNIEEGRQNYTSVIRLLIDIKPE